MSSGFKFPINEYHLAVFIPIKEISRLIAEPVTTVDPAPECAERSHPGGRRILLHAPDITLKGRNQPDFQQALVRNVRQHLLRAGYRWYAGDSRGRICILTPARAEADIQNALALLQRIPGVSTLADALWIPPRQAYTEDRQINWDLLTPKIIDLAASTYRKHASFAVRFNRVDKKLLTTSGAVGERLGAAILQSTAWDKVNLKHPDCTFHIDAYPDGLYLYTGKLKGVGGLPTGTGGRVLALLSGGIDSPVAAYLLAKRGCEVDLFHLSAGHLGAAEIADSVIGRLVRQLSRYMGRTHLHVAPYTYFDLALKGRPTGYEVVLFRRFLLRVAAEQAGRIKALALVNGDSLGQVASQTLENMVSVSRCIDMPVFRPLVGTNKDEIINLARWIGTYEISIEPYKDCCALIAGNPRTRSTHEALVELEHELIPDYSQLLERTLQDMNVLEFAYGDLVTSYRNTHKQEEFS